MKKIIILAISTFIAFQNISSKTTLTAKVDERVEFVSVVYFMMGFTESRTSHYKPYSDKVFEHFSPHLPLISTQMLLGRLNNHIDHKTMINFALNSKIANGKITFSLPPSILNSKDEDIKTYYKVFLSGLEKFYISSSFSDFFKSNRNLYLEAEELYNKEVINKIQYNVLADLCNKPLDNVNIYVTMLEGIRYIDYIQIDNSIVVGGFSTLYQRNMKDTKLQRSKSDRDVYTLVKGILDVILYNDTETFKCKTFKQTEYYYKSAFFLFNKAGYSMEEIFTSQISQLATLLYAEKVDDKIIPQLITENKGYGFIWTNELWDSLKEFKDNRKKYVRFTDYISTLAHTYNNLLRH